MSLLGAMPLLIPVVVAAASVWAAWANRPIALFAFSLTLLGYSFVTGFSIGNAYWPAGVMALIAAAVAMDAFDGYRRPN